MTTATTTTTRHAHTHIGGDQIGHKGVLGTVAFLVRLRDGALEDVAGQPGILLFQILAMALVLAAGRLGFYVRHRSARLASLGAAVRLGLPRDVGEVVLVNDSHGARSGVIGLSVYLIPRLLERSSRIVVSCD